MVKLDISSINCAQINLHHAEVPTAHTFSNIENNDNTPFIAFIQEPYCFKGLPHYLPGNCKNIFDSKSFNPRAMLNVSNSIADNFFEQGDYTSRDMVTCSANINSTRLYITSVYMDGLLECPPPLLIKLVTYCNDNKFGLIIGSDTNAHHKLWGNKYVDTRGSKLAEFIATHDLIWDNDITHFTFRRGNSKTKIDLTLHNPHTPPINNWTTLPLFTTSDHVLITFTIDLAKNPLKANKKLFRNRNKCNWELYRNLVESKYKSFSKGSLIDVSDPSKLTNSNLNKYTNKLTDTLLNCFEEACPLTYTRNPRKLKWWSDDLTAAQNRLINTKKRKEDNPADHGIADLYNEGFRAMKKLLRNSSNENWKAFCSNIKKSKDVSRINKALYNKRTNILGSLQKEDETFTSSPLETLEYLTTSLFTQDTPDPLSYSTKSPRNLGLDDISKFINRKRLDQALKFLKPNKAPGHDKISNQMITSVHDIIADDLINLYRASINLSSIPQVWQLNDTAVLPKPGKDTYDKPKSFRVINLSSCLLKLLERLVLWHLQSDLKIEAAMSKSQYGFKRGSSTEAAILKLVNKIESALKNGNFALGIFLDIEGAFDNIPFTAIKEALEHSIGKGNISNWIMQLVSTRKLQFTLGATAFIFQVLAGCPQGGVLSPFLWNLVIDGLLRLMDCNRALQAFADDLALILAGCMLSHLRDMGQIYLNKCNQWCISKGLKISTLKTQIIIFSRNRNLEIPKPIKLHGIEFEFASTIKYLGLHLDNKLNWNKHIQKTAEKCTNILFAARKMVGANWGLDPEKLLWTYKALVRPVITYACTIWCPRVVTVKSRLNPLKKLENLALLMVTKAFKSTSQNALHILLDILPLELFLEKMSSLNSLKLKNQGHWPHQSIDHSSRKSFLTCQQLIDSTIHTIFKDSKLNISHFDYISPTYIINKNYTIQIGNRQEFLLPELTENIICVYTDGSKQKNDRTGYGVLIYIHDSNTSIEEFDRLQPFNTVYQSEAYAIIRAVMLLINSDTINKNIFIFSDSQSVLASLTDIDTDNQTILNCHNLLQTLASSNTVSIQWIPAHTGYPGNERADVLANMGARKDNDPSANGPLIPLSHLKSHISKYFRNRQMLQWHYSDISLKCKDMINPMLSVNINRKKVISSLPSHMMKNIVQFITGHNFLSYHQHRIGNIELNTCQYCDEAEEETAQHIICYCPVFSRARIEWFGESPTTMSHIYTLAKANNDNLTILGKFLQKIDLQNYYKIV